MDYLLDNGTKINRNFLRNLVSSQGTLDYNNKVLSQESLMLLFNQDPLLFPKNNASFSELYSLLEISLLCYGWQGDGYPYPQGARKIRDYIDLEKAVYNKLTKMSTDFVALNNKKISSLLLRAMENRRILLHTAYCYLTIYHHENLEILNNLMSVW